MVTFHRNKLTALPCIGSSGRFSKQQSILQVTSPEQALSGLILVLLWFRRGWDWRIRIRFKTSISARISARIRYLIRFKRKKGCYVFILTTLVDFPSGLSPTWKRILHSESKEIGGWRELGQLLLFRSPLTFQLLSSVLYGWAQNAPSMYKTKEPKTVV